MATANVSNDKIETSQDAWLSVVTALVDEVQRWAKELGWKTRKFNMRVQDSGAELQAPTLEIEKGNTKLFLEPIARSSPSDEPRVDLYKMPAYDDVAHLYFSRGNWQVYYNDPKPWLTSLSSGGFKPYSEEAIKELLRTRSK